MPKVQIPGLRKASSHAWSPEQEAIFEWFETGDHQNLVVRARAGCAKTTSIIEGVNRAPDKKILLVAFNKAIATELETRIANSQAHAKTLHAVGFGICVKRIEHMRVDADQRKQALSLIGLRQILKDHPTLDKWSLPVLQTVSAAHIHLREAFLDLANAWGPGISTQSILAADFLDPLLDYPTEKQAGNWSQNFIIKAAIYAWHAALETPDGIIDYTDMVSLPLRHGWVSRQYDLVIADECQDLNPLQLQLAQAVLKKTGRMCVVGDDRQCIYAWRGARHDAIDFLKVQLQAKELGLKTTYRCPKKIVNLAQALVPDFRVAPSAPVGAVIENAQIDNIQRGDFILSRTNAALVPYWEAVVRKGIPCRIKGRKLGEDLLKLLDTFAAIPFNNLAEAVIEWCDKEIERTKNRFEKKEISKEKFNIKCDCIRDQSSTLLAFISGASHIVSLRANIDASFSDKQDANVVSCLTVHGAKGLEANNVYLITPTFRRDDIAEDNICYVAITRAKSKLFLLAGLIETFLKR